MALRLSLVVAVAVVAGCGGDTSTQPAAPATTVAPGGVSADPGRSVIEAFVAAARAGDARALWAVLSTAARRRLGPAVKEFRVGAAGRLARTVGAFDTFRVVVSERITPEFGVVGIDGKKGPLRAEYAVPLRLEGTSWKVELGSPVAVRPIGPQPGARGSVVGQIAFSVKGPGGAGTAVLYLDGHAESDVKVYGTAASSTVVANFEPPLGPGRHTVVAFGSDGREAAATAWAFTARR